MHDLGTHALLFLVTASIVVAVSCMFSEEEDRAALAVFPRRLFKFMVGSGIVLGVMLVLEHTLASVS
jgi:preprotein translocase subunit Sec61beta